MNEALAFQVKEKEAAYQQAQEANRLKSEFLAMTTHELRTPLNSMIGFADILLAGMGVSGPPLGDDARKLVTRMPDNSRHLLLMINDMLDMSRIEAGMVQAALEPFSLNEVIQKVMADVQFLAQAKPIDISVQSDEEIPDEIMGDEILVYRVLINLMSNAVKFTPEGSVTLQIALNEDGQHWIARVSDTGIGVPPEAREFIFEPFRQAGSSSRRQYGGAGLGLAICRHFVAAMGGTIGLVECEIGRGSMFEVTVPLV